jgi:hypothetical protein
LFVLGADGRGRWAALGVEDTWRWALEAGRNEALSAFWRSVADWLDAGLAQPISVSVAPTTAAPGVPVEIRLERFDTMVVRPRELLLSHAGRASDTLVVVWSDDEGQARFVAADTGEFVLGLPGRDSIAGHFADTSAGPARDGWARLGMLASSSGGRLVPGDSIDRVVRAGGGNGMLVLFALIILLAFVEWTLRRWRGWA